MDFQKIFEKSSSSREGGLDIRLSLSIIENKISGFAGILSLISGGFYLFLRLVHSLFQGEALFAFCRAGENRFEREENDTDHVSGFSLLSGTHINENYNHRT